MERSVLLTLLVHYYAHEVFALHCSSFLRNAYRSLNFLAHTQTFLKLLCHEPCLPAGRYRGRILGCGWWVVARGKETTNAIEAPYGGLEGYSNKFFL